MSSLPRKRPSVHSLLGCHLPKPARPFGAGIDDGPANLWPPDSDTEYWTRRTAYDDACSAEAENEGPISGTGFWSDELAHLESLLAHATPATRLTIHRRIDSVMSMMFPF